MPLRTVLIVASAHSDIDIVREALHPADFDVTFTQSFSEAKALLAGRLPDLLVTSLRLGEYNGLHLVLRGKAVHPAMTAIVLSRASDAALEADAERLGATFVIYPESRKELAAAIERTMYRRDGQPVRAPYERRAGERRAATRLPWTGPDRRVGERRSASALPTQPPAANGF